MIVVYKRNWMRILSISILLCTALPASAQRDVAAQSEGPLLIGTKEAPPFAMKADDGQWTGISIQLWEQIAELLELDYTYEETDLQGLLDGVAGGRYDAGVAALTVTAERERTLDFTHPFHTTGLSIAVRRVQEGAWVAVVERFFSLQFAKVLAALVLVLFTAGVLVWLFERRRNPEEFGGGFLRGIGSAFYWSAVTMTTVGYGDKAPKSFFGRIVAMVWMFAAIIIISSFTAAIASALTVGQLKSPVQSPRDLPKVRVGSVLDSSSAKYLQRTHITFEEYSSLGACMDALANAEVDAVVYDAPLLKYLTKTEYQGTLRVLPLIFERQDYAIALPEASPLRERMNRVILQHIRTEIWRDMLQDYLGTD